MATTSTDSGFYWYIRSGPKVNTIGIINEDGGAVDSNLAIELHTELADDAGDWTNDAEFLLPEQYIMKFVKGVINEYMQFTTGASDPILMNDFEKGKVIMRALNRTQKYEGDRIKPMNMRGDRHQHSFVRSENT